MTKLCNECKLPLSIQESHIGNVCDTCWKNESDEHQTDNITPGGLMTEFQKLVNGLNLVLKYKYYPEYSFGHDVIYISYVEMNECDQKCMFDTGWRHNRDLDSWEHF